MVIFKMIERIIEKKAKLEKGLENHKETMSEPCGRFPKPRIWKRKTQLKRAGPVNVVRSLPHSVVICRNEQELPAFRAVEPTTHIGMSGTQRLFSVLSAHYSPSYKWAHTSTLPSILMFRHIQGCSGESSSQFWEASGSSFFFSFFTQVFLDRFCSSFSIPFLFLFLFSFYFQFSICCKTISELLFKMCEHFLNLGRFFIN